MSFRWKTKDGKKHFKFVEGKEEISEFITWLETSPDVVEWW